MRHPGWVWLAVIAGAAAGCSSTTRVTAPRPATAGSPRAQAPALTGQSAAAAFAATLLTAVDLPSGATPTTSSPTRWLDAAPQEPGTADLVDQARFATAALDPTSALGYFASHPPAGYSITQSGGGTISGPHQPTVEYRLANVNGPPAGVDSAYIGESVVQSNLSPDRTDIRIDVAVTWLPPKPAGVTVPPGDSAATVAITETQVAQPRLNLPAPRRVTVTDPATLARLIGAADNLPAGYPGAVSCPADFGTRYQVAFEIRPGAAPNITFTAGTCGFVTVTRAYGSTADLGDNTAFSTAYERILGLS